MLQIPKFVFLQEFEKNTESASEIIEKNLKNLPEIYFYCVIDSTKGNKILSQIKDLQKKYTNLIYIKNKKTEELNKKSLIQKSISLCEQKDKNENCYIFYLEEWDILNSDGLISFLESYFKSNNKKSIYFFDKNFFCLEKSLFENLFIQKNFYELSAEHCILLLEKFENSKEKNDIKIIQCLDEKSFDKKIKEKSKNYLYKNELKSLKIKAEKNLWRKVLLFLLY
jgi:hypothetical protein